MSVKTFTPRRADCQDCNLVLPPGTEPFIIRCRKCFINYAKKQTQNCKGCNGVIPKSNNKVLCVKCFINSDDFKIWIENKKKETQKCDTCEDQITKSKFKTKCKSCFKKTNEYQEWLNSKKLSTN